MKPCLLFNIGLFLCQLASITHGSGQFVCNDTIFLFKDIRYAYDVVFIAKDSNDLQYEQLITSTSLFRKNKDFDFKSKSGNWEQQNRGLPGLWYPVFLYKSKPYLYLPSDPIYNNYILLKNETIIYEAGGDIFPSKIINKQSIPTDGIRFENFGVNTLIRRLEICKSIFENIYLFKVIFKDSDIENSFLFVHQRFLKRIPLIVHFSPMQKAFHEMMFDKIEPMKVCK